MKHVFVAFIGLSLMTHAAWAVGGGGSTNGVKFPSIDGHSSSSSGHGNLSSGHSNPLISNQSRSRSLTEHHPANPDNDRRLPGFSEKEEKIRTLMRSGDSIQRQMENQPAHSVNKALDQRTLRAKEIQNALHLRGLQGRDPRFQMLEEEENRKKAAAQAKLKEDKQRIEARHQQDIENAKRKSAVRLPSIQNSQH